MFYLYMAKIATTHCNTYMHLKKPNFDLEFKEKKHPKAKRDGGTRRYDAYEL